MANPLENEFTKRGRQLTESGQDVDEFEAPEIRPEEFADHMARMVANALSATKMFEVVEVQSGLGQVHVMGRVKRERERLFVDRVVLPVLKVMEITDDCNGFVGKQFLLKGETVKYAWVISFSTNDLRSTAIKVCQAFEEVIPHTEVTESPLLGPSTPQSGGRSTGKKGAAPIAG